MFWDKLYIIKIKIVHMSFILNDLYYQMFKSKKNFKLLFKCLLLLLLY